MSQQHEISWIRHPQPAEKPGPDAALGFGTIYTDHMFVLDYVEGQGWIEPRVEPYAPLTLEPSCMTLHYGQAVFEGLKAYRRADGAVQLFRPQLNMARMNVSSERMGIPQLDEELALAGLMRLIDIERDWVPSAPGTSLYIRPFIIATEGHLGVRAATRYRFMIILSPSGAYYAHGLAPVSIYIEDDYVRAVRGGTGFAKTPGNYAASLRSQLVAEARGYDQVLWLDGVERRFIEEVGSMNVFFVIDDRLVTPELNGSILPGITRRSVIELMAHHGQPVEERRIAIDELLALSREGRVQEVFGTGTAAVVSPVGRLSYGGQTIEFPERGEASRALWLYEQLTGMQYGRLPDELGWIVEVTP